MSPIAAAINKFFIFFCSIYDANRRENYISVKELCVVFTQRNNVFNIILRDYYTYTAFI